MRYLIILLSFFAFFNTITAQGDILKEIRYKFETFRYEDVVRLSDQIIATYRDLPPDTLLSVYTMKAVAHYTLNQEELSRRSFIELLKINKGFQLDPIIISPKIISFFESIRTEYNRILETRIAETNTAKDTVRNIEPSISLEGFQSYRTNLLQSLIFPGLGHLWDNHETEGWILTSLSAINIGSLIYFIIDTNKKENAYMNESNQLYIQDKYTQYNSSYKTRNILIASYIVLWTYSQLDLLLFHDGPAVEDKIKPAVGAKILPDNSVEYNISFKLLF